MEFVNGKKMDANRFLMQLRNRTVQEDFKLQLPITESLCREAMKTAFESEVEKNFRKYVFAIEQANVLDIIAKWLVAPVAWGLLLAGIPGTGKTTIVNTIQRIIAALQLQDPFKPMSSFEYAGLLVVTAKEVCREYVANQRSLDKYRRTFLLALDELGNEPLEIISYGNVLTPIEDLLEYRYQRRLPTIIATNISQQKIRENYGDRIASRFNEMMFVVNMPPISFRDSGMGARGVDLGVAR